MDPMIPKEMKYILHYGKVKYGEDVLPTPHGTNTSCIVENKRQKDGLWKQRTHYRSENGSLGFIETLHKQ